MISPRGGEVPGGRRSQRTPRVIVACGPYQGTWLRYRLLRKAERTHLGTCDRCGQQTPSAGAAGWFYHRGELGQPRRQLCPACLTAVRA